MRQVPSTQFLGTEICHKRSLHTALTGFDRIPIYYQTSLLLMYFICTHIYLLKSVCFNGFLDIFVSNLSADDGLVMAISILGKTSARMRK